MADLLARFLTAMVPLRPKDCPHFLVVFLLPATVFLWRPEISTSTIGFYTIVLLLYAASLRYVRRRRRVYLVDFSCFDPPHTCRVPHAAFEEHAHLVFSKEEERPLAEFHTRVLELSGLGEETALPPATHYCPPEPTMQLAREEGEMVMFPTVEELLKKTAVPPAAIDLVIVNCSVFMPVPSLVDMLIHRFGFRDDVKTFNFSGMGCSAEFISLDAARSHLQVHPESYALIMSTEIITPVCYLGKKRSMMVSNCLFRVGGAAVLLSNRAADRRRAKYTLNNLVRAHIGADDNAFQCVGLREDEEGILGMLLSKDLPRNAARALETNIRMFAPVVLPVSEKLRYVLHLAARYLIRNPKRAAFVPNFKLVFQHFCIHAGGIPLIDQVEKSLRLSPLDTEASRMTLYRIGNTSSSSVWYELGYIEAKGRMEKGHRVWQIALGGGFKCISADWTATRAVPPAAADGDGPWPKCIHRFPVPVRTGL